MSAYPVLEWMKKHNVPITRENYLAINYLGNVPEIGPEVESELPEELQLPEWRDEGDEESECGGENYLTEER